MNVQLIDREESTSSKWDFLEELKYMPKDKAAVLQTDPENNITLRNIRTQIHQRFGSGHFHVKKSKDDDGNIVAHVFHMNGTTN